MIARIKSMLSKSSDNKRNSIRNAVDALNGDLANAMGGYDSKDHNSLVVDAKGRYHCFMTPNPKAFHRNYWYSYICSVDEFNDFAHKKEK